MPPRLEHPAAATGDEDREIVVVVAVAVADAAAVDDHAAVEERAIPFARPIELLEEIGKLLDVEAVDLLDLRLLRGVLAVMGEVMVPLGDTDERIALVAPLVGEHEGRDTRGISQKGEDEHVGEDPQVFLVALRRPLGPRHAEILRRGGSLGKTLQPDLELAHGGEILVDLATVGDAHHPIHPPGLLANVVEDAAGMLLALHPGLLRFARPAGGEETVEDQLRIALLRHRLGVAPPGDVRGVDAAVPGIAVARLPAPLGADLERRQPRVAPQMGRGDLIDRDPGTDVGPGRLAGLGAGEKCRQGPGMVAGAVAVGLGLLLRQVRVDRELPRHPAERLEGRGEIEAGPDLLRCPILHVDPVGDIQEGNAARGLLGGLASDGTPPRRPGDRAGRDHRFEERKGHGRAGSAEHGASRDRLGHRGASSRGAGGAPAGLIVGWRGPRVNSDTCPGASGGPRSTGGWG